MDSVGLVDGDEGWPRDTEAMPLLLSERREREDAGRSDALSLSAMSVMAAVAR